MRDKAVRKSKGIPYAATTTLDARFSSVTYHRGKRNFGTGYDMMERIEALEADLASIEEYGTEEINEAVALRQKLARALVEVDRLQCKLDLAINAIESMAKGSDAMALYIARTVLPELKATGGQSDA